MSAASARSTSCDALNSPRAFVAVQIRVDGDAAAGVEHLHPDAQTAPSQRIATVRSAPGVRHALEFIVDVGFLSVEGEALGNVEKRLGPGKGLSAQADDTFQSRDGRVAELPA